MSLVPFCGDALNDAKVSVIGNAKILCIYSAVHANELSFHISVFFPIKQFVLYLGQKKYKSKRCGKEIQPLQESGK